MKDLQHSFRNSDEYSHDPEKCEHAGPKFQSWFIQSSCHQRMRYSQLRRDDGDDEDESSDDDKDDDVNIEEDEEEEEDHLAPANSTVVALLAVDHAPSTEETESFKTDESAVTPPQHPA
ncbi:hypothetical protein Tco_0345320 [Tanacetum coccineum]